jgi:hypothetical protein
MTATSTFTYLFSRKIKRNHHLILCGFSRFYGSISSNEDEHPNEMKKVMKMSTQNEMKEVLLYDEFRENT